MISTTVIICLLAIHWLGDFCFQTNQMALGKSSSNLWLSKHVLVYTITLLLGTGNLWFALINGVLHWPTDYFTSRWTAKLWQAGNRHDFFVIVGLDQLIHLSVLLWSATLFW